MLTFRLICLISVLIGSFITISYYGIAWEKNRSFKNKIFAKRPYWLIFLSCIFVIVALFLSFKTFDWSKAFSLLSISGVAAYLIYKFLNSFAQYIALAAIIIGLVFYLLGFQPRFLYGNKSNVQISLDSTQNSLSDNKPIKISRKKENSSAIDTIFSLTDMKISNDKNFIGTLSFTIKNITNQTITNILLRRGPGCDEYNNNNIGKETTTNYEVNLEPGVSKTFSFKTEGNDLQYQESTDPFGIVKVRFENEIVVTDLCHEFKPDKIRK